MRLDIESVSLSGRETTWGERAAEDNGRAFETGPSCVHVRWSEPRWGGVALPPCTVLQSGPPLPLPDSKGPRYDFIRSIPLPSIVPHDTTGVAKYFRRNEYRTTSPHPLVSSKLRHETRSTFHLLVVEAPHPPPPPPRPRSPRR